MKYVSLKNAVKLSHRWQTQRGLRSLILESAIDDAPAFKDAGVLFEGGSDFAETSHDKELSGISLMGSDSQPEAEAVCKWRGGNIFLHDPLCITPGLISQKITTWQLFWGEKI